MRNWILTAGLVVGLMIGASPAFAQDTNVTLCFGNNCPEELEVREDGYLCTSEGLVGFDQANNWSAANFEYSQYRFILRHDERASGFPRYVTWAVYDTDDRYYRDGKTCEREEATSNVMTCEDYRVNFEDLRFVYVSANSYLQDDRRYDAFMGVGTCEPR